ncbi:DUF3073 domain-containing protein [Nigerium massiliense]|uniref:DUF3073 domain-containing protein n=1 Tax=Nigerium massiliense TaxID=1522317 RepID=UPI00058B942C|nr:DUF3073 domain-containing protein [Nigerium massiliense]
MGRGRAKAKQTKVARDLKYRTYETDFSSLERELRGNQPEDLPPQEDDHYAEYADRYTDGEDDEPGDYGRRYG